jgi:hypothetical protein
VHRRPVNYDILQAIANRLTRELAFGVTEDFGTGSTPAAVSDDFVFASERRRRPRAGAR